MNLDRKRKKHSCYFGSCCQPLAATRCVRLLFHPLHVCIFDRWVAWLPFRKKQQTVLAVKRTDFVTLLVFTTDFSIFLSFQHAEMLKLPMMLFIRHIYTCSVPVSKFVPVMKLLLLYKLFTAKCRFNFIYLLINLFNNLFNFIISILL